MSSNIRITKLCEYCKQQFQAKKITTKYCSHNCNCKAYKQQLKDEKVFCTNKETKQKQVELKLNTGIDYTSIENKELLTINETCLLLNITHVTLRRWIKDNIITSSRIGKKHLIKRSHLNHFIA
jgi:excisionase family DNA binding protein